MRVWQWRRRSCGVSWPSWALPSWGAAFLGTAFLVRLPSWALLLGAAFLGAALPDRRFAGLTFVALVLVDGPFAALVFAVLLVFDVVPGMRNGRRSSRHGSTRTCASRIIRARLRENVVLEPCGAMTVPQARRLSVSQTCEEGAACRTDNLAGVLHRVLHPVQDRFFWIAPHPHIGGCTGCHATLDPLPGPAVAA